MRNPRRSTGSLCTASMVAVLVLVGGACAASQPRVSARAGRSAPRETSTTIVASILPTSSVPPLPVTTLGSVSVPTPAATVPVTLPPDTTTTLAPEQAYLRALSELVTSLNARAGKTDLGGQVIPAIPISQLIAWGLESCQAFVRFAPTTSAKPGDLTERVVQAVFNAYPAGFLSDNDLHQLLQGASAEMCNTYTAEVQGWWASIIASE